jgi:predicted nuclease of predicted toxin-antitoxin system
MKISVSRLPGREHIERGALVARLRCYLDENVPLGVAHQLRTRGIEVVTARDLGLRGVSDNDHLANATRMGHVLCTYDTDFIELARDGIEHAGIVLGQPEDHHIGEWVRWLELMHAVYEADEMLNVVEYVK